MARAEFDFAQPNLAAVTRACQLGPETASYWLRAAEIRSVDHPEDPQIDSAITRALALNPRYTEAWMARALRAETAGRIAEAEQDYLRASETDHMYKPAWVLANFYLRRQQPDKFWVYARKCLEVVEPRRLEPASYNPAPVFDLAWHVTQDAREIRERLLPRRNFILVDYLEYLGDHGQLDAGADIAVDIAAVGDPNDNFVLLNFCERLINQISVPSNGRNRAVDVWNAMIRTGALHINGLDPEHGQSLSNGDFKHSFERVGFDWRMPPADGVSQTHFRDSGQVRFEFSGDQPDGVLPLFQSIPVVPGGSYRLSFLYRMKAMEHADGLCWELWDYTGQRPIPVSCKLTTQQQQDDDWSHGEASFVVPSGTSVARLGLVYRRPPGTTRISGTAAFSDIGLTLARKDTP